MIKRLCMLAGAISIALLIVSGVYLGLDAAGQRVSEVTSATGLAMPVITSLRVCPTGCPYTSMQAAVDAAQDGDIIQVAAGTYTDVHPRPTPADYVGPAIITQVLYITKTVTVQGGYNVTFEVQDPDRYPTILDAGGQGRGIVAIGEGITLSVEGLRVTGGVAAGLGGEEPDTDAGGGVYVYSATLILNDCRIFSNTAESGGGVWLRGSPVVNLRRNAILHNTANIAAGLFVFQVSEVALDGNAIQGNMASDMMGGGMVFWGDKVRLTANLIQGNSAVGNGGGFWLDGNAEVVVQHNTVLSNTAGYCGGICLQMSPNATFRVNHIQGNTQGGLVLLGNGTQIHITVSNNLIEGNTAAGVYATSMDTDSDTLLLEGNTIQGNLGNGVVVQFGFSPQIYGNTILSNTAQNGAGLHFYNVPNVILRHNLIRGNSATENGGGIYTSGCSTPTLEANVIVDNIAADRGGGIYLSQVEEAMLDNNVIADNQAGTTGSGMYLDASIATFRHTTLARNNSTGFAGGDSSGLSLRDSNTILTNTVLVSHTVGITGTSSYPGVTLHSVLWYGNATNVGGALVISATNQIAGNPAFAADGYHLLRNSAAIDAGINSGLAADIDDDPRFIGAAPDLGADEYTFITLVPDYIRPVRPGDKVNYRHTLTNDTTEALIFDLTAHSSQDWEVALYVSGYPSSTLQLPYTLAAGESTLVTVSIQVPPDALGLTDTTVVTSTAVGHPTLWATATDITRASVLIYLPLVLRNG